MPPDVRTIDAAEMEGWNRCLNLGFLRAVPEGEAEDRVAGVDLDRTAGAFDGTRVVGTFRSFPTTLTVPGAGQVRASAVTNVSVAPTHRRRGLLRQMMTRDLAAQRGEALAILIASEYPIYGRFGFGPAAHSARYRLRTGPVRFRRRPEGLVELVDEAELRGVAPGVYDRYRAAQPGAILRDDRWWDQALHQLPRPGAPPWEGYQIVYRDRTGQPQGFARYRAAPRWDEMEPNTELTIEELVATTADAYLGLWRFCCEVDLVTAVVAGDRPVDELLPWFLVDGRHLRQTARFDFLWARLLDVPAALAGRRYPTSGRVVIEVVDDLGLAAGRVELDGGPDGAICAPSERSADLTAQIDALSCAYLGGVSLRALARAGRVDEHRAGALAEADTMFRSDEPPWCSTWF